MPPFFTSDIATINLRLLFIIKQNLLAVFTAIVASLIIVYTSCLCLNLFIFHVASRCQLESVVRRRPGYLFFLHVGFYPCRLEFFPFCCILICYFFPDVFLTPVHPPRLPHRAECNRSSSPIVLTLPFPTFLPFVTASVMTLTISLNPSLLPDLFPPPTSIIYSG